MFFPFRGLVPWSLTFLWECDSVLRNYSLPSSITFSHCGLLSSPGVLHPWWSGPRRISDEVDAWYFSPYPQEFVHLLVLYICEFCLAYLHLRGSPKLAVLTDTPSSSQLHLLAHPAPENTTRCLTRHCARCWPRMIRRALQRAPVLIKTLRTTLAMQSPSCAAQGPGSYQESRHCTRRWPRTVRRALHRAPVLIKTLCTTLAMHDIESHQCVRLRV